MIEVVDAVCGSGKTTWIFNEMRKHTDRKWLFVSPYLDEAGDGEEAGRIQKELPELSFKSPTDTPTKSRSFLRLAKAGENISCTHKLFTQFTPEVATVLQQQEYHLVIDETINLVDFYEDINSQDVIFLVRAGMVILCESTGRLSWNNEEWPNYTGRDLKIKQLCELGCLWLYGENVLIQRIPPTAMKACNSVTILTYMFEASLMHSWMELNSLEWKYLKPPEIKTNAEIKSIVRNLLNIIEPSKTLLDMQKTTQGLPLHSAFSSGWYSRASEETLSTVKTSLEVSLKKQMRKGLVFWTTFKDYKNQLTGIGYTRSRKVDGVLLDPFISKNERASNQYKDFVCCIHTVNVYPHVSLVNHLNTFGVSVDQDLYALSELIQFVFRGCIRQHQEMDVLVVSDRMRSLLCDWLKTDN